MPVFFSLPIAPVVTPVVLAALLCTVPAAHAQRSDKDKPIHIEADTMRHDEARQTSIFTGRVLLTKGSMVLRGARLEVRQDAQGHHHGVVTGAAGQRAFFRQQRDSASNSVAQYVEGEAETIEYNGRTEDVRLLRRGQLRRYSGDRLADDISGALITYNAITDIFTVDGQRSTLSADAQDGAATDGRVRAVFTPRKAAPTEPDTGTREDPSANSNAATSGSPPVFAPLMPHGPSSTPPASAAPIQRP